VSIQPADVSRIIRLGLEGGLENLWVVGYDEDGQALFQGPWTHSNLLGNNAQAHLHFSCTVETEGDACYVKYFDLRDTQAQIGGAMFDHVCWVSVGAFLEHVQPILIEDG